MIKLGKLLDFFRDFLLTKHTYETNAQGDVTGLVDGSGSEVVNYTYDSWGKLLNIGGSLASIVGTINPFRYRGYYYDTETGLYLLQSRYYNPEIGRFISKDDPSYHVGSSGINANLYAYCSNNPIMRIDPTGHVWGNYWWNSRWFVSNAINLIITAIIGGGLGAASAFFRRQAARYGERYAATLFAQSVARSRLAAIVGYSIAQWVTNGINVVFNILMWAIDPGGQIFNYLDSRDRYPNNGYLNY